jgi:hypothetical protein
VGGAVSLWDNITLTGTVGTDAGGEKYILLQTIDTSSSGSELVSLGMNNATVTDSGLLARVWGVVIDSGEGYFVIDDGSGSPVWISTSNLATPLSTTVQNGGYVAVTGVLGIVVRPRGDRDITILLTP